MTGKEGILIDPTDKLVGAINMFQPELTHHRTALGVLPFTKDDETLDRRDHHIDSIVAIRQEYSRVLVISLEEGIDDVAAFIQPLVEADELGYFKDIHERLLKDDETIEGGLNG